MSRSKLIRRLVFVLMISFSIAFLYASYRAIDNIVAEQSRVQQRAISPVFDLVRDELLRPLYIAETLASSIEFKAAIDGSFDEDNLLRHLQKLEQDLGLVFFVASEQSRKQYFSNGTTLDLVEGEVAWYFEAKATGKEVMADLGQVGDVHLFYDVSMKGPDGEFLGYVGAGKRVQRFLRTFDRYKALYGYDFLFVNDRNEIILTSFPDLVVTGAYIPTLESTAWFSDVGSSQSSNDSDIIQIEDQDFLISEFAIEALGWRLMLLSPLEARQAQITNTFLTNALAAVFIVLLMAGTFLLLLLLYKRNIDEKTEIDALTGLPTRALVQRRYDELQRAGVQVCAIIIDLDHFKEINDSFGHDAGDQVLQATAEVFRHVLREGDVVGRWGGEEFVMLIPASSIEMGQAIAERARRNLEELDLADQDPGVTVTASFGVAFGSARHYSLTELLTKADEVLYQAKQKGRNQVRLYEAA